MADSSSILKKDHVFVEYLEEDGKWYLCQVPYEVAFVAVVQYPENYHILDSSMVILEEKNKRDYSN